MLLSTLIGISSYLPAPDKHLPEIVQANKDDLEIWLDLLETKELPETYNRDYCITDTNGKLSCGCLQFQADTFQQYGEIYKRELFYNAEDGEILNFWLDCNAQKQLAYIMIRDRYLNWTHWRNSVKKIGLPPIQKNIDVVDTTAGKSS